MNIGIVDYGVGNIFSVGQALKSMNFDYSLQVDGDSLERSDLVIVPGVAAFGVGMKNLEDRGLAEGLLKFHRTGKPIIGLCLGAQMFLSSSMEAVDSQGLDMVSGKVIALDDNLCRVPQQGWTKLNAELSTTFAEFNHQYFYFSHSYKMILDSPEKTIGSAKHGGELVTAFYISENILGVQFHPERSGPIGLKFLEKAIKDANIWS